MTCWYPSSDIMGSLPAMREKAIEVSTNGNCCLVSLKQGNGVAKFKTIVLSFSHQFMLRWSINMELSERVVCYKEDRVWGLVNPTALGKRCFFSAVVLLGAILLSRDILNLLWA
ncbi:hypothetical protein SDJN02_07339 [Cucurbita argyrosperma subsp. argyrosperma]|nr:hypothetical protein SDJN02_07339 [Cucurbita argyrosperma subsp. argyrosperma]